MIPTERRLLTLSSLVGAALTLFVLVLWTFGALSPLDRWLYDGRLRWFQYFTKSPTDRLVHIDVNDQALETIARWPWDRTLMGALIDEIHKAGAKVIALDIVFSERQRPRNERQPDGSFLEIRDDAQLAQAVSAAGQVLMPLNLNVDEPPTALQKTLRENLIENLELTIGETFEKVSQPGTELPPPEDREDLFVGARRAAMFDRLDRELDTINPFPENPDALADQLRERLLPGETRVYTGSPLQRLVNNQLEQVRALRALRQHSLSVSGDLSLLQADDALMPIPELARATGTTGFVTYVPDDDGVVRSIPLLIRHRDDVFAQFGLVMACAYLDVPLSNIRAQRDRIILPINGGRDIVIPVHERTSRRQKREVGMLMDVPWFGKEMWQFMFDYPRYEKPVQHMPINMIWDTYKTRQRLINNSANADRAIRRIYRFLDPEKIQEMEQSVPPYDDMVAWAKLLNDANEEIEESGFRKAFEELDPSELSEDYTVFIEADESLQALIEQIPRFTQQLQRSQNALEQLKDKAVLIGWTATALAADFVPTSLHHKSPGAVVHGVIFNGIVTRDLLRRCPGWIAMVTALVIGIVTTLAASTLSPLRSLIAAILLAGAFLLVDGLLLFDYANLILDVAGTFVIIVVVWGGCTLARFVVERAERTRITKRFRSYVDPVLVNYVIEHPEQDTLAGQVRELSVVFTDLQGFTTLSERLQEQTVPLLQEYMGLMVPIIRQNDGYVNKFLGDGIMFFYGAPLGDEQHSVHAVHTALEMQEAMADFNRSLTERDLPNVLMRVGISTGPMVVGDAGPANASDYTVLGDAVNLGARLESANKATGTRILMTKRTTELLDGHFLIRPIAKLQVVGKQESEMTYEAMAFTDKATVEQHREARLTQALVDAFVGAQFRLCLDRVQELDQLFGPDKFTDLYREQCENYLANPPTNDFDGAIVLTTK